MGLLDSEKRSSSVKPPLRRISVKQVTLMMDMCLIQKILFQKMKMAMLFDTVITITISGNIH